MVSFINDITPKTDWVMCAKSAGENMHVGVIKETKGM
jgi:hypothetical protein